MRKVQEDEPYSMMVLLRMELRVFPYTPTAPVDSISGHRRGPTAVTVTGSRSLDSVLARSR